MSIKTREERQRAALTEVCSHCGFHQSQHSANCPRVFAPVTPLATAYDRDQQALRDRVDAIEAHANEIAVTATLTIGRLADRVFKLECDIALDRAEAIKSEKRIEALLDRVNQLVEFHGIAPIGGARVPGQIHVDYAYTNLEDQAAIAKQLGGRGLVSPEPKVLDCGCIGRCNGHQFSASPATAYPPLPDEGT